MIGFGPYDSGRPLFASPNYTCVSLTIETADTTLYAQARGDVGRGLYATTLGMGYVTAWRCKVVLHCPHGTVERHYLWSDREDLFVYPTDVLPMLRAFRSITHNCACVQASLREFRRKIKHG